MKIILSILALFTVSCANVSTTRLHYTTPEGGEFEMEFPKEVQATEFSVVVDFREGKVHMGAGRYKSSNTASIEAQGVRESSNLSKVGDAAGKVTKGAVEGAVEGLVPVP